MLQQENRSNDKTMSDYLTLSEVAELLRVSKMTVVRRMRKTPDDIDSPWVTLGGGVRPTYRFKRSGVDEWWSAVNPNR